MSTRDRVRKYRKSGGAADLVRVEVLVPEDRRAEIVALASEMRSSHRQQKDRLAHMIESALQRYKTRVTDNIDLDRIKDLRAKARIVGTALIERGDARAFALGRELLREAGD